MGYELTVLVPDKIDPGQGLILPAFTGMTKYNKKGNEFFIWTESRAGMISVPPIIIDTAFRLCGQSTGKN
jgi:hypothetical protein